MKDVYGGLSEAGLLPRERDVVSGRLSARRDDKRRERDESESSRGPGARTRPGRPGLSRRTWWMVGAAAVLLVATVTGAVAVAGRPDAPKALSSAGSPTAGGSPSAPVPASPTKPTEPAATAIRLDYSGGKLIRNVCSDASGRGECSRWDVRDALLTVRCTSDGCSLYIYGKTQSIDAPVSMTGDIPNRGKGCAPTHWTLELKPVGRSVTEGITHPARLVGTGKASRPAALVPGFNCLGADQIYRYDATPS